MHTAHHDRGVDYIFPDSDIVGIRILKSILIQEGIWFSQKGSNNYTTISIEKKSVQKFQNAFANWCKGLESVKNGMNYSAYD